MVLHAIGIRLRFWYLKDYKNQSADCLQMIKIEETVTLRSKGKTNSWYLTKRMICENNNSGMRFSLEFTQKCSNKH